MCGLEIDFTAQQKKEKFGGNFDFFSTVSDKDNEMER